MNKSRQIVEKKMSIKAMERFARKMASNRILNKDKTKITIRPVYIRKKYSMLATAYIIYNYISNVICINDFHIQDSYYNKPRIQAVLLHEVGHLVNRHHKKHYMNEFKAQRWAINKAKRLKLPKVVKILKTEMRNWSEVSDKKWRKRYRIHIKAAKYANKVGLI